MINVKYISSIFNLLSLKTTQRNILVLDIDNTILKTETHLGSDQWYTWQYDLIKEKSPLAIAHTIPELNQILNNIYKGLKYQLCEEDLPLTLSLFKRYGIEIILLTARDNQGHQNLLKNLQRLNIYQYLLTSVNNPPSSFKNGIIYCNGGHKGKILQLFIQQQSYKNPVQIIFVDDKVKNLEHVKECFSNSYLFLMTNQYHEIESFNKSRKENVIMEYNQYLLNSQIK